MVLRVHGEQLQAGSFTLDLPIRAAPLTPRLTPNFCAKDDIPELLDDIKLSIEQPEDLAIGDPLFTFPSYPSPSSTYFGGVPLRVGETQVERADAYWRAENELTFKVPKPSFRWGKTMFVRNQLLRGWKSFRQQKKLSSRRRHRVMVQTYLRLPPVPTFDHGSSE